MAERLSAFEERIRQSLEGYEAPYDPSGWEALEERLDRSGQGKGPRNPRKWYAAAIGGVMVLGLASYLYFGDSPIHPSNEGEKAVAEGAEKNTVEERQKSGEKGAEEGATAGHDQKGPESSTKDPKAGERPEKVPKKMEQVPPEIKEAPRKDRGEKLTEKAHDRDPKEKKPEQAEVNAKEEDPERSIAVSFTAHRRSLCAGEKVRFRPTGVPSDANLLWRFGDGSFSRKRSPGHQYEKPGQYDVTLSISIPGEKTSGRRTKKGMIRVHERPEAEFTVEKDKRSGIRPMIEFRASTENRNEQFWKFGDGSTSREADPSHSYERKGIYQATLISSNEEGCADTVSRRVSVDRSFNLLAPTAFTPNGDGLNDAFMPKALKKLDRPFTMTVHDPRTGRVVFETTDPGRAWRGDLPYRDQKAEVGESYFWVVVLETGNGEETYKGQVTVAKSK